MANVEPARWARAVTRRRAVVAATGVAMVTCLSGLGYQPLSWDEAVTLDAAEHRPSALYALLRHTDAPLGLYYLLMHEWVGLLRAAGATPTAGWLRLPSAAAAIVTVALVAVAASNWFGPAVGLVAGLLLAVHPLFVFYAHDARPYPLATLLVVVTSLLFLRARRGATPGTLGVYAAAVVVTAYVHLFAVLALLGHIVAMARGPQRGRWALVCAVAAVAIAPLVYVSVRESHEIGWIPHPSVPAVASVLVKLGGSAVFAVVLAVLVACAPAARLRGGDERTWIMLGWALLPPVLLVGADFVTPVLVARYALVAVPAVVVVAARSVAPGRSRTRAHPWVPVAVALLAVVAGAGTSAVQQSRPYKYEDYRSAADLVDDNAQAGDAVVFVPAANRVGYDDYAGRRAGRDVADVALRAGGGPAVADQLAGRETDPATTTARTRARARVFLVGVGPGGAAHGGTDLAKLATLRAGYEPAWSRRFGDVTVTLFTRPPVRPTSPLS